MTLKEIWNLNKMGFYYSTVAVTFGTFIIFLSFNTDSSFNIDNFFKLLPIAYVLFGFVTFMFMLFLFTGKRDDNNGR